MMSHAWASPPRAMQAARHREGGESKSRPGREGRCCRRPRRRHPSPVRTRPTRSSSFFFVLGGGDGCRALQFRLMFLRIPVSVPAHTTWLGTGPVLLTHQKSCLPPVLRSLHPFIMGEMRPLSWVGVKTVLNQHPRDLTPTAHPKLTGRPGSLQ